MLASLIYGTLAVVTCSCLGAAWAMIGTIRPEAAISAPARSKLPAAVRFMADTPESGATAARLASGPRIRWGRKAPEQALPWRRRGYGKVPSACYRLASGLLSTLLPAGYR